MSGQSCQWVRKSKNGGESSPSSKQGPMKATLPMSSLMRQNSNLRNSNNSSPTLSPTSVWKSRFSPTDSALSGVRSPGAVTYSNNKCKTLSGRLNDPVGGINVIRRTASFDTIYLKGQWPRESLFLCPGQLCLDKAIQTDDCSLSPECTKSRSLHSPALDQSKNEDKLEKYMRQRLERTSKEGNRNSASSQRERTAAFGLIPKRSGSPRGFAVEHGSQTRSPTSPLSIGGVNIPLSDGSIPNSRQPMRSSVEGLNQEIERLVLKAVSSSGLVDSCKSDEKGGTPEGHRAPLADLLRCTTRSVNTQTPSAFSTTPLSSPQFDRSRPSSDLLLSGDSSPDHEPGKFGASPRINKFLAREPPDGCEKVSLKFVEDNRKPMLDLSLMDYCPLKPCVNFTLKPSLGSAFYPLPRPSQSSISEPPRESTGM